MKWIILVFTSLSVKGISQTSPDSLFKKLIKNEQDLVDAIATGNKTIWNTHLHDSCIIAVEDGKTMSKQTLLEDLKPLPVGYIGRIQITEPHLKVYGSTAVISFINDEYLELFNQKIHTQYRQSDTWVKVNNEWKVVSMQLFEIPKNPPPILVDSTVMKKYTGSYALSPEKKCLVYVENGKLFAKKGSNPPIELFAETENVFFRQGDGRVNVLFIRNPDGFYKMIERREGEDLTWKKF